MTMLTIRIVKTLTVVSILAVCHCATIIQGQQERQAVAVAGREGAVQEEESSEAEEESEEESFYFYLPDRSSPIYEEVPPIDPTRDKPDWIFNPNSGHRLVEFYAHWYVCFVLLCKKSKFLAMDGFESWFKLFLTFRSSSLYCVLPNQIKIFTPGVHIVKPFDNIILILRTV